ncbi:carbohydrate ABC transporter permease [Truepera radiovictrix]|uniref:Binding-protein-dependent transport systems inner membrane component n=1 Tax=Truepera radiovictrix (strain DSM 17093 / CIP 108686 / LMG 22925 / RQ-24) TaxID=649638 RepID=D7CQG0_TRURR|nr:carbohydrate ABC transporter permease [Truepera radiovictrix]ADI14944.1 binding-protein-dependent transport systems inner membrane component [Truepera radiovictrix DSM 17093]WMT56500.1 carbohydrate ABC transporter permease [Truepera radiovictrix]
MAGSSAVGRPARARRAAALGVGTLVRRLLIAAVLIVGVTVAVFPFLYLLLQSLAPWDQVDRRVFPTALTLRSYRWLLFEAGARDPWLRALFNSFFVTVASVLLMVTSAGLVGYALSHIPFRGRAAINNVILFHMFFPGILLLVPTFLIVRYAGLYNTYAGMIIPTAMSVWAIFMYTSFFKGVSSEMIEAARIDGASEAQIVFRIIVPVSLPITSVITLFLFMDRWGQLLWDLMVVSDRSKMTLSVLLASLQGSYAPYPGPIYAASTLLTLPVLIVFWLFRRNFTAGIAFVFK